MDCSLPGSSVHGILQARVLEWGAIAFSRKIQNANTMRYIETERGLIRQIAEEGESKMNWESSINMYTLPCIKYVIVS